MRRIGLRTIKTAISVFFCLLFYILLKCFELIPGVPDDFAFSWYNPFFAGIATAYSVHASKNASIRQAKNRCVASLIGGITGIILITIYELCGGVWPNLASVNLKTFNYILPYLLISFGTIIVVIVGIVIHQQPAIFVAILTFLSVTVNPNINVGQWQWQFGTNRILSTIIGVLIALSVNLFHLPHRHKNRQLLFCVGIDGMLLSDGDRIKGFMQYKLNYLHQIKANVTLFTTRTPTTFMPLLQDVKISHPIVCMSGAALYDAEAKRYLAYEAIEADIANRVREILKENGSTPFINRIENDVLFTYCASLDNLGEQNYAESKRNASYCCYLQEEAPASDVLYFLLVENEKKANELVDLLKNDEELSEKILIQVYDIFEPNQDQCLKYIKIYSKKIEKLEILNRYVESKHLSLIGLTTTKLANHLLMDSSYAITIRSAADEVKQQSDFIIPSDNPDDLFKMVQKIYYKNLSKYGNKE